MYVLNNLPNQQVYSKIVSVASPDDRKYWNVFVASEAILEYPGGYPLQCCQRIYSDKDIELQRELKSFERWLIRANVRRKYHILRKGYARYWQYSTNNTTRQPVVYLWK